MEADEFKRRFLPYHKRLYRTAFHLLGNTGDAEDIVQDAYLKLWNRRDELENIENAEAYLTTLVKNLCYDTHRIAHHYKGDRLPEELQIADNSDLAQQIERHDEASQVKRLIGLLPQQQKEIITMRDIEELSYEEIEAATGLTSINIRVLLSRARKKIREQFKAIMNYENR